MPMYLEFPSWIKPEVLPFLPIRWYAVMYLVAALITFLLVKHQVKKDRLDFSNDKLTNLFFWAFVGLMLGARIFAAFVYERSGRYVTAPWLIFWPFDSRGRFTGLMGMSYHGGVIGCAIAIIIYCRVTKISALEWGDRIVGALPLGYTFGRLGNFINSELYGRVTSAPWGIVFPNAETFPADNPWVQEMAQQAGMAITGPMVNLPRHPSQLYEALLEGVLLWLILWFVFRPRKPFNGFIVGMYFIGYGVFRFIIEYFREPDKELGFVLPFADAAQPIYQTGSLLNFTTGQLLCFLLILAGALCLLAFYLFSRFYKPAETAPADAAPPKRRRRR